MPHDIDVTNYQMVSMQGDTIVVLRASPKMTKREALVHAAWLVTLADDENEFQKILGAVQNT